MLDHGSVSIDEFERILSGSMIDFGAHQKIASPLSDGYTLMLVALEFGLIKILGECVHPTHLTQEELVNLDDFVQQKKIDLNEINKLRKAVGAFYRYPVLAQKPAVLACAIGTGVGKSFGSLQGYLDYVNESFPDVFSIEQIGKGDFVNHVFMTPQKAQISLSNGQIKKLQKKNIQFASVLSIEDFASDIYIDWLTGLSNDKLYSQIFKGLAGMNVGLAKGAYNNLKSAIRCLEELENRGKQEEREEVQRLKSEMRGKRWAVLSSFQSLCVDVVNRVHPDYQKPLQIADILRRGIKAQNSGKQGFYHAALELLKRVFPFEVCKHVPCVIAMTSHKSLKQMPSIKQNRDGGYGIVTMPFDALVGGKEAKPPHVGEMLSAPPEEQEVFLRDVYFAGREKCSYKNSGVAFNIVVDELHDTYNLYLESTLVNLISDSNLHLSHVLSAAANVVRRAERFVKAYGSDLEAYQGEESKEHIGHILDFRKILLDNAEKYCEFTEGYDALRLLEIFWENNGGTFEVDGKDATTVTSITHNTFAFNARMFTNMEELKGLRIRSLEYEGTQRLYLHPDGALIQGPSMFDLYQLLIALIVASAQKSGEKKNRPFLDWLRNGHHNVDGSNDVLYNFIMKVREVAGEVDNILDQPDLQSETVIDHLFAYFQPKLAFSFIPLEKDDVRLYGDKTEIIRLSFKMDLIKASPEVSILRMLVGTKNRVIPLSATSAYEQRYDGNYSTIFLRNMCKLLGIDYLQRLGSDLDQVEILVEERRKHRDINFNIIAEDALQFFQLEGDAAQLESDLFSVLVNAARLGVRIHKFKLRELKRQVNLMVGCYVYRQSGLALAISHDFAKMIFEALRSPLAGELRDRFGVNVTYWQNNKPHEGAPWVLECDFFKTGYKLRVILFDAQLVKNLESSKEFSFEQFVAIEDMNTSVLLVSSFKAAGTGLNNVLRYVYHEMKKNGQTEQKEVEEDYPNLFICGSPFYSNVWNGSSYDTLSNYAILLKNFADRKRETRYFSDLPKTLNTGEAREILAEEHALSNVKSLIQSIGRVERRDTKMTITIHMPEDLLKSSSFIFKKLSAQKRSNRDYQIYRGMSVLGKAFADKSMDFMWKRSFISDDERRAFETYSEDCSRSVEVAHLNGLRSAIRLYKKSGEECYRKLNDLMRSVKSLCDPQQWMQDVEKTANAAGISDVEVASSRMFLSLQDIPDGVVICENCKQEGFSHKLTDFSEGRAVYDPWSYIFPTYDKEMVNEGDRFVQALQRSLDLLKEKAVASGYIPVPSMIPLLRGNVGEYVFEQVTKELSITPLTNAEVKVLLGSEVYEVYDYYIVQGRRLYCVDVKYWSTRRQNPELCEKVRSNRNSKPQIILDAAQRTDQIDDVVFLYANAFYGNTVVKENRAEMNHDHSIYYINILQRDRYYETEAYVKDQNTGRNKWGGNRVVGRVTINSRFRAIFN